MIQRTALPRDGDHAPLSIRSMSVVYGRGHRPEDAALWNASAEVRARSMTAIVGPNGAGKSTLLNAALGLVPRLAGDVRFFGRPFAEARERVAYLPQRESIDWDFPITALDVVRMGATRGSAWWTPRWARPRAAREETTRAMEALERVGMMGFAERAIGDLSGGQQQRVFLARALAQDADLLLLDEPFAAVDATTEGILRDQLRGAVANGKTVVSVHHDLGSIEELFDDVILVDGTVTDQGPAARVLGGEAFERAFGSRTAGPVGAA